MKNLDWLHRYEYVTQIDYPVLHTRELWPVGEDILFSLSLTHTHTHVWFTFSNDKQLNCCWWVNECPSGSGTVCWHATCLLMCLCSNVDLWFLLVNIRSGPASHEEKIPSNIVMKGLRCLEAENTSKQHVLEYIRTHTDYFHRVAQLLSWLYNKYAVCLPVCVCMFLLPHWDLFQYTYWPCWDQ